MLSGTGPCRGRPVRPLDGKPVHKAAWIQCVGSRDLQTNAGFCSAVCCMVAIKEALMAKEKIHQTLEATIFYMDMRTYGKGFDRYRQQAETVHGIHFERGRIHSVEQDANSGDLIIRSVNLAGEIRETRLDLVVLTVGQRPARGTPELADILGLELNTWGFGQSEPFSTNRSGRAGIVLGGAFTGLKDIGESVIQASAAALNASRVIHAAGGSLALEPPPTASPVDVMRERPKILVVICTCGGQFSQIADPQEIARLLKIDPLVAQVEFMERTCTAQRLGKSRTTGESGETQPGSDRCLPSRCVSAQNQGTQPAGGSGLRVDRGGGHSACGRSSKLKAQSSKQPFSFQPSAFNPANGDCQVEMGGAGAGSCHSGHSKGTGYRRRHRRYDGGPGYCRSWI